MKPDLESIVKGAAYLTAPRWAQDWFVRTAFCPWGCGMQMAFHALGDPVCDRRQIERYEDQPAGTGLIQPAGTCLVYILREWAEGRLDRTAYWDAGDGYVATRLRVLGNEVEIGVSLG